MSIFPREAGEVEAYVAGIVASDGNITCVKRTCKIKVVTSEEGYAYLLLKLIFSVDMCDPRIYVDKKRNRFEVYCYSRDFADILEAKYYIKPGKKASIIRIPKIEEDLKLWFVRGLYDGDSSITEAKIKLKKGGREYCYILPRIVYKTKSIDLAQDLKSFLRNIRIGAYIWRDANLYSVTTDGISNLLTFSKEINYLHPIKRRRLLEIISRNYSSKYKYYMVGARRRWSA